MPSLPRIFLAALSLSFAAGGSAQFDAGEATKKPAVKPSEGPMGSILDKLLLRELGPSNMAGRIADIAVYERDPRIFYVASAAGGVWKTKNSGTTFEPIFQQEESSSLGAVAVSATNPDIVWVGTGEASSRNSVGWGDGIYKSTDGGKTFLHCGLSATMHIGKIKIHPKNPNVVWVAATGRLWGRSEERGIYKTTDGGKTWRNVLHETDKAGGIDLDVDPTNPQILYASLWDRIRKPYVFASGGITGGLFKSVDGGETWRPIMKGLPSFPVGRIGLDVYRRDPKILVALVEYYNPNAPASNDGLDEAEREQQEFDRRLHEAEGGERERGEEGARMSFFRQAGTPAKVDPPKSGGTTTAPKSNQPEQKKEDGAQRPATPGDKNAKPKTPPKKKIDPKLITPPGGQMNGGGIFLSKDGGESWTFVRQMDPRPFYFSLPVFDPTNWKRIYIGGLNLLRSEDGGFSWKNIGQATHADHHAIWVDPRDGETLVTGCDGGVNISRDRGAKWDVVQSMPIGQFYAVDYDVQRPYWVFGGLQDNGSWGIPTQTPRGGIGFWDAQNFAGGDGFFVRTDKFDPAIVYAESQGGAVVRTNRSTGERKSLRPGMNKAAGLRKGETLRSNWDTPIEVGQYAKGVLYVGAHRLLRSMDSGNTFAAISPDLTGNSPRKEATAEIAKRISINGESTGAENHCTIVTISESPVTKGVIATGSDDGRINLTTNDGKTWVDLTDNLKGLPNGIWCSRVILSRWNPNRIYATFDNHRYNDFHPYLYRSDDLGKNWIRMEAAALEGDCLYVIREDSKNPGVLYLGSEYGLRISMDEGKSWSRLRGGFPTTPVYDVCVNPLEGDLVIGTHGRAIWTLDLEPIQQTRTVGKNELYAPQDVVRMPFVTQNAAMGDRNFIAPNTLGTTIYYRLAKELKDGIRITIKNAKGEEVTTFEGTESSGLNAVKWSGRSSGVAAPVGDYTVEVKVGDATLTAPLKVVAPVSVQ